MKLAAGLRSAALLLASVCSLCLGACSKHDALQAVPVYPPLPVVFASPNSVAVGEVADEQEWPVPEVAWGKESEREHLLPLLGKCSRLHQVPVPEQHDFQFTVLVLNGKIVAGPEESPPIYDYISKTGEIGEGNQWYYVPAEFRVGMLRVKARLPKRKPTKVINLHGATIIVPK